MRSSQSQPVLALKRAIGVAVLSAATLLAGCDQEAKSHSVAEGFAAAYGYRDVVAKTGTGMVLENRASCDGFVQTFVASNGSGIICTNGGSTRFLARSDVAVSPRT